MPTSASYYTARFGYCQIIIPSLRRFLFRSQLLQYAIRALHILRERDIYIRQKKQLVCQAPARRACPLQPCYGSVETKQGLLFLFCLLGHLSSWMRKLLKSHILFPQNIHLLALHPEYLGKPLPGHHKEDCILQLYGRNRVNGNCGGAG